MEKSLSKAVSLPLAQQLVRNAESYGPESIRLNCRHKLFAQAEGVLKEKGKGGQFSDEYVYAATAHDFFRRVLPEDFKQLCATSAKRKEAAEFLRWLFKNPDVMFSHNALGPFSGDHATWFSDWFELWRQRPNSHSGVGKKSALVLAHANASHKILHAPKQPPASELIKRHDWFMNSVAKKIFIRDMEKISPSDLRFILGAHFSDSELQWCQTHYQKPGFQYKSADGIARSHRLVKYQAYNDKIHISDTTGFYKGMPLNIEAYVKHGGQCVAVSRTGAAFCVAAGVPAFLVTQPNHLAYFWKDTAGHWRGGNDMLGWNHSSDQKQLSPWGGLPELILLYDEFHSAKTTAKESLVFAWAARAENPASARRAAFYKASLERNPKNYAAIVELLRHGLTQPATPAAHTRAFLLDTEFSALAARPLVLQQLLEDKNFHSFLQRTARKSEQQKFKEGIYVRYAKTPVTALAGSAQLAAVRNFLQHCPTLKIEMGNTLSQVHDKIKDSLQRLSLPDARLVLDELQTAVRFSLENENNARVFFPHIATLCARGAPLKHNTLIFLKSLSENKTNAAVSIPATLAPASASSATSGLSAVPSPASQTSATAQSKAAAAAQSRKTLLAAWEKEIAAIPDTPVEKNSLSKSSKPNASGAPARAGRNSGKRR